MQPQQSALIVPVPEAEPAVADLRARLDRSASWGVPAHISVIFPFLPPPQLNAAALAAIGRIAAGVPRFYLNLDRFGWFDQRVLWLSPSPAEPFRELTNRLAVRFPAAPPYGGQFPDVIPHLTIGHDHPAPELAEAADRVRPHLPIRARVTALRLITGRREAGDSWQTLADFPLG